MRIKYIKLHIDFGSSPKNLLNDSRKKRTFLSVSIDKQHIGYQFKRDLMTA